MIRGACHRRRGARRDTTAALYVLFAVLLTTSTDASSNESAPVANFSDLNSSVTEQNGRIELKVTVSREFSGSLAYSVEGGTPERGADFKSAEFTAIDRGREAVIVIELHDDDVIEDLETIQVTLQQGEGYQLGSARQHTVTIRDNDESWRVVHHVEGMTFEYGMQITRDGDGTDAKVTSDGLNGLPAGTYPVRHLGISPDNNRFEADIGPIMVGADQTLLGAELARNFRLFADPADQKLGHSIDYSHSVIGSVTETWTAPEGGYHLTGNNPISGTFLMSRVVSDATQPPPTNREEGIDQDDGTGGNSGWGGESGCPATDLIATGGFTAKSSAMPAISDVSSVGRHNPLGVSLQSSSLGQPFAPHIPYPGFISETLNRARAELYYDKAPTQEAKDAAAFRYKALLYERKNVGAETYIRARFKRIEDFWDCAARERAHQAANGVIGALRYAPWNRELRWALLDIYYDVAVAEKALAQEKHVAVAEIMLEPKESAPGESLIDKEIVALEETLPLYRGALAGYMKVMRHTYGVDPADYEANPEFQGEPFGSHLFRQEAPLRSPLAALFKNADDEWVLPLDATAGDKQPLLFEGYKDVTLLFDLLREYLRTAEQLSKSYLMRGKPSDLERAERLVGAALLATWVEGNALVAMFPEIREKGGPIDPRSGLKEAVTGWRHSYSALSHIRGFLSGNTNLLGFDDGFLVLPQSVIKGDPASEFFQSYDHLSKFLKEGPLQRAIDAYTKAGGNYKNFRDRHDQLAQQFSDRAEHYDEKLREIVGVRPDEPGYGQPAGNEGGEISRQLLNIKQSRLRMKKNHQEIENLEEEIRIEIQRRGEEAGINDAIKQVYLKYGNKGANLTEEIAKVNESQAFWRNVVSSLAPIAALGATAATGGAAAPFLFAAAAGGAWLNAPWDASKEGKKGRLQAQKDRLAAQERAKVQSKYDDLSDRNSRAFIRTRLLRMSMLDLESAEAAIGMRQGLQRLAALYLEKEDLERRKAESNEKLADRYFADPSHRLLKNSAVLRAETAFADAQRWMFLTIRAAEYKWNQAFEHTMAGGVTFTRASLFGTRNARELDDLFGALEEWQKYISVGAKNDNSHKVFSIRTDFLGYESDGEYFHPDTGKKMTSWEAFRYFITQKDNYLDPGNPENRLGEAKLLKLRFSTAFTPERLGIFMPDQWLEKIDFLRVILRGGYMGPESIVKGRLCYGGVSLIRNQSRGSPDPEDPGRLLNETTAYSTRHWFVQDGQWRSKAEICSSISIQVGGESPKIDPSVYKINSFKEYSVATTSWTLYIPVESTGGIRIIDVSTLADIEFHIHYYSYSRTDIGFR